MKISILELREMVARAVRQTVREAKAPKLPAQRSEESVMSQRDRQVRGLPGYAHSTPHDMSKPLGKRSRTRRQGASNIGNWTSESRGGRTMSLRNPGPEDQAPPAQSPGRQLPPQVDLNTLRNAFDNKLFTLRRNNPQISYELDQIARAFNDFVQAASGGKSRQSEAAIRKLVGMIVDEEVRVSGRR